jgi:hypothetical protein
MTIGDTRRHGAEYPSLGEFGAKMRLRKSSTVRAPIDARQVWTAVFGRHLRAALNVESGIRQRRSGRPWGYKGALLAPLIGMPLGGCDVRGAPSFVLFGAYFPAWMLLALLAIVAAILARAVFLVTGLARVLPFQLFVCASIGVCAALFAWSKLFEH